MKQTKIKNKILLINPQYHRNWQFGVDSFSFPIGLMYLGTGLKKAGFEPIIIDTCIDENFQKIIKDLLPETVFAGLSVMTPQVPHALHIAKSIRALSPSVPLVWGGIHPTLYPDTALHPLCDIVIKGEGDLTVLELTKKLAEQSAEKVADQITDQKKPSGKNPRTIALETLKKIPGLALGIDGEICHTPTRPAINMDELPWVDYSLIDSEKYIYTWSLQELRKVRVIPIHAARGCPWHCTFCINTTINSDRRYRYRSNSDILDEIEHLIRTYNLEMIILSDEEFFANRERVEKFLDGIEARGLTHVRYNATCRVNHFRPGYIDTEFLQRLKRCGFVNLVFGFESGSPKCLEIIQKEITVDQGLHAARMLATEGFMAVWGFIMAIPGETRKDIIKTLRVMKKIRDYSADNYFIGPQIFRPYPGSELYKRALASGLKEPADLDQWGQQEFTGEGWIGSGELQWIDPADRDFVDYVNYIGPVYYNARFLGITGLKKLYHSALRLLFRFRLIADFWAIPFEHRIRDQIRLHR